MVLPPTDDAIFGVVGFPGAKSVRGHQFGLGAFRALLSLSLSLSLGTFLAILMGVKRYMSFFGCGRRPFTKRAERRRRRLPSTAHKFSGTIVGLQNPKGIFSAIQFRVSF